MLFSFRAQSRNQELPHPSAAWDREPGHGGMGSPSAIFFRSPSLRSEIKAFDRKKLLWSPPPPSRCFVHTGLNSTPLSRKEEAIHAQYTLLRSLSSISERFPSKNSF